MWKLETDHETIIKDLTYMIYESVLTHETMFLELHMIENELKTKIKGFVDSVFFDREFDTLYVKFKKGELFLNITDLTYAIYGYI